MSQARLKPGSRLPPDLIDWRQEPRPPPFTCPSTFHLASMKEKVLVPETPLDKISATFAVREATRMYWELLLLRAGGFPTKSDFLMMMQRVYRALLPALTEPEIIQAVTQFYHDSLKTKISYWDVHQVLVNLTDAWIPGFDQKDFALFLRRLFHRITLKIRTFPDGSEERKTPNLTAVLMKSPGNPLFSGWTEVVEGEAYSGLYVYKSIQDAKGQKTKAKKLKTDLTPQDDVSQQESDLLYDEIPTPYEETDCLLAYEFLDLSDIVPIGEVAEAYLAHLKFKNQRFDAENESRERPQSVIGSSKPKKDITPVGVDGRVMNSSFPNTPDSSFSETPEDDFSICEYEEDVHLGRTNYAFGTAVVSDPVRELLEQRLEKGAVFLRKTTSIQMSSGHQPSGTYYQSDRLYDLQVTLIDINRTKRQFRNRVEALKFLSVPRRRKEGQDLVSLIMNMYARKYGKKKPKITVKTAQEVHNDVTATVEFLGLDQSGESGKEAPTDGFLDIVEQANAQVYKVLLIGKPRCGKTTVAALTAAQLHLKHIECGLLLETLLSKAATAIEDLDSDPDSSPIVRLSPFEQSILVHLTSGLALSDSELIQLLKTDLNLASTQSQGFILDLPWTNVSVVHIMKELETDFTHIIELWIEDEDLEMRIQGIRQDPGTGKMYTRYDINQLHMTPDPRKRAETDESEEAEIDEEPEDENGQKLNEGELLERPEDDLSRLSAQCNSFKTSVLPQLKTVFSDLPSKSIISVPCAGLTPVQCVALIRLSLSQSSVSALKLTPAGDFKDLLLQDLREGQDPRLPSPWKKYDPVALRENELIEGTTDLSAEYMGKVFLFKSEENLGRFLEFPQMFLRTEPALPDFRVVLIGADASGTRLQAEFLSAKYGWKVIDAEDLLNSVISAQRKAAPRPSHPDAGPIQASGMEFSTLISGGSIVSPSVWPLIMQKIGLPLWKKPAERLAEEEGGQETHPEGQEQDGEPEAKKGNSDAHTSEALDEVRSELDMVENLGAFSEAQTAADSALPTYEEPKKKGLFPLQTVFDDLPLTEIARKLENDDGLLGLGSFILVGFPGTEEEIEAVRAAKVDLHKVIYLSLSEEALQTYDSNAVSWGTKSVETAERAFALLKEAFGEEKTVEISVSDAPEQVFMKILTVLDPFITRPDSEDMITSSEETPAFLGESGPYDPVISVKEHWLVPGNKDIKAFIHNKEYRFQSQIELDAFSANPGPFIIRKPTELTPHLMIMGVRGAGVNTQIRSISADLKIPEIDLRDRVLTTLEKDARDRRHFRYLLKGFRPAEDSGETGLLTLPEDQDPDCAEEDPDFDRNSHEIETIKRILGTDPAIIRGTWVEIGEKVASSLPDLLFQAHRLPEIVVFLTIDERSFLRRNLDLESIQKAHQEEVENIRKERARKRLETIQEDQGEPLEEELPALEGRIEQAKQALLTRFNEDSAALEEVKAGFEEKGVPVMVVDGSGDIATVRRHINYLFKPHIQNRANLISSQLGKSLSKSKAEELLRDGKVLPSPYGQLSAVSPYEFMRENEFPVLYRDRIYWTRDKEEQGEFLRNVSVYSQTSVSFPVVPALLPSICILGPSFSGVSTLSRALSLRFGLIQIRPKDAIKSLLSIETLLSRKITQTLQEGKPLSDDLIVEAVAFRLSLPDVAANGYVLDGFPRNLRQAQGMLKAGFLPNPVVALLENRRIQKGKSDRKPFKLEHAVRKERRDMDRDVGEVCTWYETIWDNVHYLPPGKSKWFSIDFAQDRLTQVFKAKLTYLQHNSDPVSVVNLGFPRLAITRNPDKWRQYDPVVWRLHGVLDFVESTEFALLSNKEFAFFSDSDTRKSYQEQRKLYEEGIPPLPEVRPQRLTLQECAGLFLSEIRLEGHCPVCIKLTNALVSGAPGLLVSYDGSLFSFDDSEHLALFLRTPGRFSNAKMPEKHVKPTSVLTQMAEFEAVVPYLEQHLGVTLMKGMMETAAERLCFPRLTVKETALKYIAMCLKAGNPKNTLYSREKYTRKIKDFKRICETQSSFLEQSKERLGKATARRWEDSQYFEAAALIQEVNSALETEGLKYFNRYIR